VHPLSVVIERKGTSTDIGRGHNSARDKGMVFLRARFWQQRSSSTNPLFSMKAGDGVAVLLQMQRNASCSKSWL
jgi:hypothetical protein